MKNLVESVTLGTAGHIDHGKSALVRRLTGIDPDRLKEEQLRGMTIDLGYAFYTTRLGAKVGIIDVPGHEKFVKNMVTGAASIDIVALVVAADDGVMPQTREHLEIMDVMGITRGLVALTKVDLVDAEMIEMATLDVSDLVEGTFLEGAPIVPLSSQTGEGFETFVDRLEELIASVEHVSPSGLFRLPVQRVFSVKGFGTVVTGVPISGSVKVGDTVELLPNGVQGKVRGMQAFDEPIEEGKAGHRIAMNISDVDYRSLRRGCTVATPGYFKPCTFFEGHFRYFDSLDFPLNNNNAVKVHAGTAEEMAKVVLLDRPVLLPGETGFIQLRLEKPMVVVPGDPFLIRRHSPALSLGGGTVVELTGKKIKRFKAYALDHLEIKHQKIEEEAAALAAFEMRRWKSGFFSIKDLSVAVSQDRGAVEAVVQSLADSGEVGDAGRGLFIHRERFEELAGTIAAGLDELHRAHPLQPTVDMAVLRSRLNVEPVAYQMLMKRMEKEGYLETARGGRVRTKGYEVALDENQRRLADQLVDRLKQASLSPPMPEELARELGGDTASLFEYLSATGEFTRIQDFFVSTEVMDRLKEAVVRCAEREGEVKIPLLKEEFATTRKFMIPIMEHLDAVGLTRREGDRRFLAKG